MLLYLTFCSCDLDLDLVTLTCKLDLDILKMCILNKIKFLGQGFSKLEDKQDRQTHTHRDKCDQMQYHEAFTSGKKHISTYITGLHTHTATMA